MPNKELYEALMGLGGAYMPQEFGVAAHPRSDCYLGMEFLVFTFIREKLQIFRTIVLFVFDTADRVFNSFMVDYLFRKKESFELAFHHKSMLENIIAFIAKRVMWGMNVNITIFCDCHSAFPGTAVLARKLGTFFILVPSLHDAFCTFIPSGLAFSGFATTPFGAMNSFFFQSRNNIKFAIAGRARFLNFGFPSRMINSSIVFCYCFSVTFIGAIFCGGNPTSCDVKFFFANFASYVFASFSVRKFLSRLMLYMTFSRTKFMCFLAWICGKLFITDDAMSNYAHDIPLGFIF